jgi:hypothetical protein
VVATEPAAAANAYRLGSRRGLSGRQTTWSGIRRYG